MTEFLKNLQNKPEPIKKTIMWASVTVIMITIFSFWVFTFSSRMKEAKENTAAIALKEELPNVWQTLKSQIKNIQDLWVK